MQTLFSGEFMLTIIKFDGLLFHVKIGSFSTIEGMTKKEILSARVKYKFKLKFANDSICKRYNSL